MRETGVVRRRVVGDPDLSQRYFGLGRVLLGRMKNYLGAGISGAKTWLLADGTIIRTSTGPHGDTIAVDVRVPALLREFYPLEAVLSGFVCTPHSSTSPLGYNDPATTGDHDEVVLQPLLVEGAVEYEPYLFNNAHRPGDAPVEFAFSTYEQRFEDTSYATQVPWYPDGIAYGTLDWRNDDHILTWYGARDRYQDWTAPAVGSVDGLRPGMLIRVHTGSEFESFPRVITRVKQVAAPGTLINSSNVNTYFDTRSYADTPPVCWKGKALGVGTVSGACLHSYVATDGSTKWKLVVIGGGYGTTTNAKVSETPIVYDFDPVTGVIGAGVASTSKTWLTSQSGTTYETNTSAWLFNKDGTAAVMTRTTRSLAGELEAHLWTVTLNWGANGVLSSTTYTQGARAYESVLEVSGTSPGQTTSSHPFTPVYYNDVTETCESLPESTAYFPHTVGPALNDQALTVTRLFRDYRGNTLISGSIVHTEGQTLTRDRTDNVGVCTRVDGSCSYDEPELRSIVGTSQYDIYASALVTIDGVVFYTHSYSLAGGGTKTTSIDCAEPPVYSDAGSESGTWGGPNSFYSSADVLCLDMRDKSGLVSYTRSAPSTLTISVGGNSAPATYTVERGVLVFRGGVLVDSGTTSTPVAGSIFANGSITFGASDPDTAPVSTSNTYLDYHEDYVTLGLVGEHAWLEFNAEILSFSEYIVTDPVTLTHLFLSYSDPATETGLAGSDRKYAIIGVI